MYAAHLIHWEDPSGAGGIDTTFQVVAGRSSALFALLAGVGIALSTRDVARAPGTTRLRLTVRALLVAAIGLWLGSFDSGLAVILTFYGLLFLCALPVLTWGWRPLALLAAGWGLLSPVVSVLLRHQLDPGPKVVPSLASLGEPVELVQQLLVTGYYPVLTWATYLFAGMAIARLDLRRPAIGARLALVGAWLAALTLAASSWVTSTAAARSALLADPRRPVRGWEELDAQIRRGMFGTHPDGTWWWLGVWSPHSGSIIDLAHTTATAMLVLGLCLWLVQLTPALPWRLLAGAGAMTLTLYTVHVLVVASPWGDKGGRALVIHTVVSLAVGATFAGARLRGPLEWGVSSATRAVRRR